MCNKLEEAFGARAMWSLHVLLAQAACRYMHQQSQISVDGRSSGAAAAVAAAVTQSSPSVTTTNTEIIQGCCAHCSAHCFQVLGVSVEADEQMSAGLQFPANLWVYGRSGDSLACWDSSWVHTFTGLQNREGV